MVNWKAIINYAIFGGAAGALFPILMRILGYFLKFIGISVTQATVQVNLTAPSTQLSGLVTKLLSGNMAAITGNQWGMAAIGGAMTAVLGYLLIENIPFLAGLAKTELRRATGALTIGSALTVPIIAWKLSVPSLPALVSIVLGAWVFALVYIFAAKQFKKPKLMDL